MNSVERTSRSLRNLAALGLLVLGLSSCSSGDIDCLSGQKSGIRSYPNVVEEQTVNFQGVPLVIKKGTVQVGPNEKHQISLTVHKLFSTIAFTATLQSTMNKLPAQDLNIEWQCVQK